MRGKRELYYILIMFTLLLGIHRGRIAIWYNEDPEPQFVLPYSADLLPEADREALEKGIRLHSREELTRYLEDFCS